MSLSSRFRLGFLINSSFMIFELVVGLLTGSLILIADAAHNLTDSVTLTISWIGNKIAQKPADKSHSLGHGRISVLAALINSVILVVMAVFIFFESYQRFQHPQELSGGVIAFVGMIGIFANGMVAFLFRKNRDDLNVEAAFTNMAFDAIFSIAAFVAGVLIAITGQTWIDPLISVGVGVGLIYAAIAILRQATHIFLEGVPKGVDLGRIKKTILENKNINAVKDVAVWAIASNEYVLCCTVTPLDTSYENMRDTIKNLKRDLKKQGFTKIFIEIS